VGIALLVFVIFSQAPSTSGFYAGFAGADLCLDGAFGADFPGPGGADLCAAAHSAQALPGAPGGTAGSRFRSKMVLGALVLSFGR